MSTPYLLKEPLTEDQLATLLAAELNAALVSPKARRELENEVLRAGLGPDVTAALIELPSGDLFTVARDERPMGFAFTGAAFLIGLKAVAAYIPAAKIAEAALAAGVKMLLEALIKRIRRKKGVDYIEERTS